METPTAGAGLAPPPDLVLENIGLLATPVGPRARAGAEARDLRIVKDALLASSGGRIVFAGSRSDFALRRSPSCRTVDARGGAVVPGFVDPHTHLAFAGDRDEEIRRRLAGATYKEIAAEGGGIVRTVSETRKASVEELADLIVARLDEMVGCGTTTAEVKSGYGLETRAEVRSLEAIARAAAVHPVRLVSTFMGAHEVPEEFREDRAHYLALLAEEMIPEVARRGLARFCDVFCEEGVFTVDESRLILERARAHGLLLRIHADELKDTGGAGLAAALGVHSADHLIHVSAGGIRALSGSGTVATLLPSAAFYLRLGRFAPARELIAAGVPVAFGTDVNPGAGLSPSLPFAATVGCFAMGLSVEESLTAITLNAAASLDLGGEVGSLEVGKSMDAVVLRSRRLLDLVRIGAPVVQSVIARGKVVFQEGTVSRNTR
jgi:imidazolonepropionase